MQMAIPTEGLLLESPPSAGEVEPKEPLRVPFTPYLTQISMLDRFSLRLVESSGIAIFYELCAECIREMVFSISNIYTIIGSSCSAVSHVYSLASL